jgi:hypothetical protein
MVSLADDFLGLRKAIGAKLKALDSSNHDFGCPTERCAIRKFLLRMAWQCIEGDMASVDDAGVLSLLEENVCMEVNALQPISIDQQGKLSRSVEHLGRIVQTRFMLLHRGPMSTSRRVAVLRAQRWHAVALYLLTFDLIYPGGIESCVKAGYDSLQFTN